MLSCDVRWRGFSYSGKLERYERNHLLSRKIFSLLHTQLPTMSVGPHQLLMSPLRTKYVCSKDRITRRGCMSHRRFKGPTLPQLQFSLRKNPGLCHRDCYSADSIIVPWLLKFYVTFCIAKRLGIGKFWCSSFAPSASRRWLIVRSGYTFPERTVLTLLIRRNLYCHDQLWIDGRDWRYLELPCRIWWAPHRRSEKATELLGE